MQALPLWLSIVSEIFRDESGMNPLVRVNRELSWALGVGRSANPTTARADSKGEVL
jgi:hypothetical protein